MTPNIKPKNIEENVNKSQPISSGFPNTPKNMMLFSFKPNKKNRIKDTRDRKDAGNMLDKK